MKMIKQILLASLVMFLSNMANADSVKVVKADFKLTGVETWTVSVTLSHADTGWAHYADNWQVVDADGNVLGDRVLHHPHVNEQPFTRSLSGVKIPSDIKKVYIRAHDNKHGWSAERLEINLASQGK